LHLITMLSATTSLLQTTSLENATVCSWKEIVPTDSRNNSIVGNMFYRLYHIGILVDLIYNAGNVDGLTISHNRLYNVISPPKQPKPRSHFRSPMAEPIKYVDFSQSIIRDTRTGGNEAYIGIQAITLTDAEPATWEIHDNIVVGPTTPYSVPNSWPSDDRSSEVCRKTSEIEVAPMYVYQWGVVRVRTMQNSRVRTNRGR
jgi:hypothetical protein